jgi:hypothetical protein
MVVDDRHYSFPRDSMLIQRELASLSPNEIISIQYQSGSSPELRNRHGIVVIRTNRTATPLRFPPDLLFGVLGVR